MSLYLTGEITIKAQSGSVSVYRGGGGSERFNDVLRTISPSPPCYVVLFVKSYSLVFSCLIISRRVRDIEFKVSSFVKERPSVAIKSGLHAMFPRIARFLHQTPRSRETLSNRVGASHGDEDILSARVSFLSSFSKIFPISASSRDRISRVHHYFIPRRSETILTKLRLSRTGV